MNAAYVRVSSEEQRERQAIETQRQSAERYVAQRERLTPEAYRTWRDVEDMADLL